jgi:hypothetical protein
MSHEPPKKKAQIQPLPFLGFFFVNQFKKDDENQVGFLKDLMFFVIKDYSPMRIVESIWF